MQVAINIPMCLEQSTNRASHFMITGEGGNSEHSFVVVEGHATPCVSLPKAVDICFTLTYVLDVNYCWRCSHTFVFLQKYIYCLGKDRVAYLCQQLSSLGQLCCAGVNIKTTTEFLHLASGACRTLLLDF